MGDSPGPITRQRSSSRGVAPYEKPPALGRQRSSTDGLTGAIDQLDTSLEEKPKDSQGTSGSPVSIGGMT